MIERKLVGQYAGFLSRAVGLILDYLIIAVVIAVVGASTALLFNIFHIDLTACPASASVSSLKVLACLGGRWFVIIFGIVFTPLYYLFFWPLMGQTMGQRVMGLRVVKLDGRRMSIVSSLIRWIGYQVCIVTLGIGFLWVLIDDRRMGWHDKLARTCVIYSWKAEQNERFVDKVNRRFRRGHRQGVPDEATRAALVGSDLPNDDPTAQEQLAGQPRA
jgi:uncharacterized RDD family membrane protein YckC